MPNLNSDDIICSQLDIKVRSLEKIMDADVLAFNAPLINIVDNYVRDFIELLQMRTKKRKRLVFILTTNGGYIEIVHRIVDTIRHYYEHVSFIVPDYAYSAGTVLAMSGDAIYMDYYSRLGPIDPQVELANGHMVPALGYLIQWERLLKKAKDGTLTQAEQELMATSFDQAELYKFEQERQLSITLLEEWLVKYKFKNWDKTRTKKENVTTKMKRERANQIAKELNNTERWHVHGHGISMDVLRRDDINLIIDDFGENRDLNAAIKKYYNLLQDYTIKSGAQGALHIIGVYKPLWQEEAENDNSN